MEQKFTYAKKGTRTVGIVGADSTSRCTIMLGCNLTGTHKLPPFIIYKGAPAGRINRELERRENLPCDCEFGVQERAWMDEVQMVRWIGKVWKPYTETRGGKITYLIMDECRTHMTGVVKRLFEECRTEIDFIPGGYTSKLQPMDVGINKPFKNYVRNQFDEWMIANLDNNKPKRSDVALWVSEAWKEVSQTTQQNSWRKCGFKTDTTIEYNDEVESAIADDDNDDDDELVLQTYLEDNSVMMGNVDDGDDNDNDNDIEDPLLLDDDEMI
jgi:hypothetical protein